jgi:hypothetical protein
MGQRPNDSFNALMGDAASPARDAQGFKKYSQMKLQMKREALEKLNRSANENGVLRQTG